MDTGEAIKKFCKSEMIARRMPCWGAADAVAGATTPTQPSLRVIKFCRLPTNEGEGACSESRPQNRSDAYCSSGQHTSSSFSAES